MKKSATSREDLLKIAKDIASREGIGSLNIRRLASESGIAIGTVYNYYPSKGDVIGAVIEDFWRNVFHGSHFDVDSDDFIGSCHDIYLRLRENLKNFREEFLKEMEALSQTDQKRGKELEAFYLEHMKEGLLSILERDWRVDDGIWNETFTRRQFISFAFSNLVLLLKEKEDPTYFEEIMKRLIYRRESGQRKEE